MRAHGVRINRRQSNLSAPPIDVVRIASAIAGKRHNRNIDLAAIFGSNATGLAALFEYAYLIAIAVASIILARAGEAAQQRRDLCFLTHWRLAHRDTTGVQPALARLKNGACYLLLRALLAAVEQHLPDERVVGG